MENNITRVAIDGPAAAGKSTVAKMVADQLAFVYVDTGAMYRALTLKVINEKIQIENERAVIDLLQQTSIDLIQNKSGQTVLLDGEDVTEEIRSQSVNLLVSKIAQINGVRKEMVHRQKLLAENKRDRKSTRLNSSHVAISYAV